MLKGISVTLYERTQGTADGFNRPTYTVTPVTVENVLVAPASEQEVLDSINLTGRKVVYTLGIPKGDNHDWEDVTVEFWGEKFHTVGMPTSGIEAMIPLSWNTKVRVERYGERENQT